MAAMAKTARNLKRSGPWIAPLLSLGGRWVDMNRFLSILGLTVLLMATNAAARAQEIRIVSDTASSELISDIQNAVRPDSKPETEFEARRQARSAAERARNYLNSRAYFAPDIEYAVDAGAQIVPLLRIDPGPRFTLSEINLDIEQSDLPANILAKLAVLESAKVGELALPDRVVAHESALVATLRQQGYPDAKALSRNVVGDRDAGTIAVTFKLRPGQRARFGDVRYTQDVPVRKPYLDRLVPFDAGEWYSPQRLSDYNRRLRDTRMFAGSTAQLAEPTQARQDDGDVERPVAVTLNMRKRYSFGAGASFSTAEGAGLTTELTRHNATRRGDTLTGQLSVAQLSRSASVDWRIPNAFAFDHTIAFSAAIDEEETDAFDREALEFNGTYSIRHSPALTSSIGFDVEFASEVDAFEQRDVQVISGNGGFRYDRSDDALDPSQGWRAETRIEPTAVQGDDTANFVKLNSQVTAYRPLNEGARFVAAGRVRAGFIYGARLDDVPVSRRFYAGGGGSARGFEYQSVGPEDEEGQPTGGRGLFEASAELRMRSERGFGAAVFLDAATVSGDQAIDFGDLRSSAGVGIRYATPVGPIRFDVATPIDRNPGDDSIQIYISIGQAF